MSVIFLPDLKGVYRQIDRVVNAHEDPADDNFVKAIYVSGDGKLEKIAFFNPIWQSALIATYPLVPCAPGHFVITAEKLADGTYDIRRDAIIGWRCNCGFIAPATLHPEHDSRFLRGRGAVIEFPDKHVEDLFGGNYASLEEYLEQHGDHLDRKLTPLPFQVLTDRLNGEDDDEITEPSADEDNITIN